MKKTIFFLLTIVTVLCYSCSFSFSSDQKDLQEQITQLQQEVATLQKINGLKPSYDIKNDSTASPKQSNSNSTKGDDQQTVKAANEQTAIEAIKYCLKMYVPDLKYTNIRSVPQSDGTVDVIIDYKILEDMDEHTYYNVSVYSNNEFKVNSCRGIEGVFPHHSKMMMP